MVARPAPSWHTTVWFNSDRPLDVSDFRGKTVLLYAFQMLCPACVTHGIPQASKIYSAMAGRGSADELAVVGLHTVFEHHEGMGPASLKAFLQEFGVEFPVGVDEPSQDGDPRPRTMREYGMQGTPTVVLIDKEGNIRKQVFGIYDDFLLGLDVGRLLGE